MDRITRTAAVFGTPNAQHPQPCRHEVEHLADRLADCVECPAAARADVPINVPLHILAWQMAGKSLPPRCRFAACIAPWCLRLMCLRPCNIGIEVFQAECELISIDPLRASSELRPLQPLNDEPKSLDLRPRLGQLRLIARQLRSQVTHQLVQRIDVRRQRGEIDSHEQESSAATQRRPIAIVIVSQSVAVSVVASLSRQRQAATAAPVRASRRHQSASITAPRSVPASHPDPHSMAKERRPARAAW